jgi:hypothetical protein
MVRKVVQRGLYPILASMMTGFFFVPVTFATGKSAEQRTFATVQDGAEALGTAYGKGDRKAKRWRFDPSEGYEDLLSRRTSKTELSALNVVIACFEAQKVENKLVVSGNHAFMHEAQPKHNKGAELDPDPARRAGNVPSGRTLGTCRVSLSI